MGVCVCVCVCVFTAVCVHLDGLNAEHKFRVWVTILGHTSHYFTFTKLVYDWLRKSFTFTFMNLADAFIQSDLHCIQVTVFTFYQLLLSLGIKPMILAFLAPCSTI